MVCRVETEQDAAVAIDALRTGCHLDIRGGFPGASGLQAAFPRHFYQADAAATGTIEASVVAEGGNGDAGPRGHLENGLSVLSLESSSVEMNREDARAAAGQDYEEIKIAL